MLINCSLIDFSQIESISSELSIRRFIPLNVCYLYQSSLLSILKIIPLSSQNFGTINQNLILKQENKEDLGSTENIVLLINQLFIFHL